MRIAGRVAAGLALALVAGCGAGPPRYDVTGAVTLDGEPLAAGDIILLAADGSSADGGRIEGGRYKVQTSPGSKKVSIQATVQVEGPGLRGEATIPRGIVPPRYNTETTL